MSTIVGIGIVLLALSVLCLSASIAFLAHVVVRFLGGSDVRAVLVEMMERRVGRRGADYV